MEHQKDVIVGNKDAVRSYVNHICSVQSRSFATNSYQTKDNISFVCYSVRHMSKAEKALSSSCKFHVKAKLSSRIDGKQSWVLKQHCFHTCTHEESKRKRSVRARTKLALNETLYNYIPGVDERNGKQLLDMANKAHISLSERQSRDYVMSKKHRSLDFHLASYWFLSELFSSLKKEDEKGTYVLETSKVTIEGVQRDCFNSYYVSPSFVKNNFINNASTMVAVDGTFTRIPYFSDLYLTAVTVDSNRQVSPARQS